MNPFMHNGGHIFFKNFALFTPQDFASMFDHFSTLCMKSEQVLFSCCKYELSPN